MLNELRCNKLIDTKLEFNDGLNVLVGPNDGANSIGKSSVLMLIDFAFSGDDFIKLSSDIIDNVGIITVEMDFIFDGVIHKFSRATNDPSVVTFITESEHIEKPISEYREFLKENYKFPDESASFRSAVNPFFRIWGKENNNPNKPLNSFPSEPYSSIKPNVLKLFSLHGDLKELELEKKATQSKKSILKGAFNEGYIKP
ncbi:flagellar protein FlgN, partial [Vibrio sp. 10N.222.46.A1]